MARQRKPTSRPTIEVPTYVLCVGRDLCPEIRAFTVLCNVDDATPLLDGPQVHVTATGWESVGNGSVESDWSLTVTAFVEAEALEALDGAWERLRADITAGRPIGWRPVPQ